MQTAGFSLQKAIYRLTFSQFPCTVPPPVFIFCFVNCIFWFHPKRRRMVHNQVWKVTLRICVVFVLSAGAPHRIAPHSHSLSLIGMFTLPRDLCRRDISARPVRRHRLSPLRICVSRSPKIKEKNQRKEKKRNLISFVQYSLLRLSVVLFF